MLAGQAEDVVAGFLGPSPPLWLALLPTDRERVARWVRQPRPPLARPSGAAQLVSEGIRERQRDQRLRITRDVGLLVGTALVGAGMAVYVGPPVRAWLVWLSLAWLVTLLALVRFVVHKATGHGIVGTPEGNERYFDDPEAVALGWPYSLTIGLGLAIWVMLAALVARGG